ncbi:MAG TPA: phospholipase D-like domain-containing protein [Thermoanaerobaculia bacterium]|nr:phospholipase D-like domain-containing protein [Thermoanaerobaculia bacterium]
MGSEPVEMPGTGTFRRWLENLKTRDEALYADLVKRLEQRKEEAVALESMGPEGVDAEPPVDIILETIVREGRPALLVKNHRITKIDTAIDSASAEIMGRLRAAQSTVEPLIPLVGRIDLANDAAGRTFAGTGWLIDKDVVATNRHVAEIIARADGAKFVFKPGRFGDPLRVSIDFRHELGTSVTDTAPVKRVIWIETDSTKADFALLQIGRRTDGTVQDHIKLAETDLPANSDIVVIGYPARAPEHVIPDQAWMDRIYGGKYDVKRVAPGLFGPQSRGWATHDATTLGGNSGSVVLDMKTGRAVALHFAGLYMIENYCVPASTLRKYLKDAPWIGGGTRKREAPEETSTQPQAQPQSPPQPPPRSGTATIAHQVQATSGEVTITIPLTIRISLGTPVSDAAAAADDDDVTPAPAKPAGSESTDVLAAARSLRQELRGEGVLAVRHGYRFGPEGLSDTQCLVVAAHPERIEEVRARAPKEHAGFPVEVRTASLRDQAGELADEAGFTIAYNDDERRGPEYSFAWVDEEMDVTLHVGPERSWTVLRDFLLRAEEELVSSIYEFHAGHIADALERELDEGTELKLVMAVQSRDSKSGHTSEGDFKRTERFAAWRERFGDHFAPVFVPIGNGGLIAKSYHIKVTVRDGNTFWLSSGNWKRASQPNIPPAELNNPKATGKAGNREWHVVIENETLAQRYRSHIAADYELAGKINQSKEAAEDEVLVDVPMEVLESVELEAAPTEVFEPKRFRRRVKVKPLLTPDRKGEVYSAAVLKLIRSAKKQLLFQNQYITVDESSSGFFGELVDALVDRSRKIKDVRIILRSGGSDFWDNMAELKRRGMDVNKCVRRISATHTKGIIVDGREVLIGSHNWSSLGVTLNRDASLIFRDEEVAQYFAQVFEHDWDRASPAVRAESVFAGEPRLATTPEPPPGYVRMTLSEYLEG